MATQGKREPIISTLLDRIDVSLDRAGGRVEGYVQMLLGVGDRAQKIGLVGPVADFQVVGGHRHTQLKVTPLLEKRLLER